MEILFKPTKQDIKFSKRGRHTIIKYGDDLLAIVKDVKNASDITFINSNLYVDDGEASFSISGSAKVNNLLSVDEISPDPDGTGSISCEWQSSSDADEWEIISDKSTYYVKHEDSNKYIRAIVSYEDKQGFSESITTESIQIQEHPYQLDLPGYSNRFGSGREKLLKVKADWKLYGA